MSYSFILFAFVAGSADSGPNPGPPLALGLSLVPFVFVVAAFSSRHQSAAGAVLKAMGLWAVIGIPVAAVDLVSGLVAGFGAGAIATIRRGDEHTIGARSIAVALSVVYVFVLVRITPEAALVGSPMLPFVSVGLADSFRDWRAAQSEAAGEDENR